MYSVCDDHDDLHTPTAIIALSRAVVLIIFFSRFLKKYRMIRYLMKRKNKFLDKNSLNLFLEYLIIPLELHTHTFGNSIKAGSNAVDVISIN